MNRWIYSPPVTVGVCYYGSYRPVHDSICAHEAQAQIMGLLDFKLLGQRQEKTVVQHRHSLLQEHYTLQTPLPGHLPSQAGALNWDACWTSPNFERLIQAQKLRKDLRQVETRPDKCSYLLAPNWFLGLFSLFWLEPNWKLWQDIVPGRFLTSPRSGGESAD